MRKKNAVDDYVEDMMRLKRRAERIPHLIARIEELLYSGQLSAREFEQKANERRMLYKEMEEAEAKVKKYFKSKWT